MHIVDVKLNEAFETGVKCKINFKNGRLKFKWIDMNGVERIGKWLLNLGAYKDWL